MKKLILVAVIGILVVSAAKGSKWFSHIRSELAGAKEWAESKVPPEKEISRLRNEVKLLDKDILTVVNQLARERVECNELKEKVADLRAKQATDKDLLNGRGTAIKAAEEKAEAYVDFGNRKIRLIAAKADLEEGAKRYESNRKSLETMELTLDSRERIRDGLEKQLETLKNKKSELSSGIDALEAELTMLKLQQMESKYQTDDTRLAKIKESMRDLRKKLDVEREKLKLMPAALDAPTPTAGTRSVDEILAPVNAPKPAAPAAPATGSTKTFGD
jgi:chromosome segregation ATPase